ncbi:hypothetical protein [Streptomyces sp. NPDC048309]
MASPGAVQADGVLPLAKFSSTAHLISAILTGQACVMHRPGGT